MNFNMHLGFACKFKIQKFNEYGNITYDGPEFSNTMLDSGLLKLFSYSILDMIGYINIGSGSSSPSPTQTGLDARTYTTSNIYNSTTYWTGSPSVPEATYTGYCKVFQFNVGTCTGIASEVGLSRLNNADYLNRQLLRNEYGSTTSIEVASNEGVRISIEVRCYLSNQILPHTEIYQIKNHLCDSYGKKITLTNGINTFDYTIGNYGFTDLIKAINVNLIQKNQNNIHAYTMSSAYIHDNNFVGYLYGHPLNDEPLNLSMTGNTITDTRGGDPFEFTMVKGYIGKQSIIQQISYYDDVSGITQSLDFELFQGRNNSRYSCPFLPSLGGYYYANSNDGIVEGIGNHINSCFISEPLSNHVLKVANPSLEMEPINPTSVSYISSPSEGNFSYKIKSYYSPGAVGSGTQTIKGFYIARTTDSYSNRVYQYVVLLKNFDFVVTDIEEFWTEMTISWGAA